MHFTSSIAQAILCLSVTVLPVAQSAIAIGNQIRDGNTHYNVAWIEGISPCVDSVEIGPESGRECNKNFHLNNEDFYLVYSNGKTQKTIEAYLYISLGWMRRSQHGLCSKATEASTGQGQFALWNLCTSFEEDYWLFWQNP